VSGFAMSCVVSAGPLDGLNDRKYSTRREAEKLCAARASSVVNNGHNLPSTIATGSATLGSRTVDAL